MPSSTDLARCTECSDALTRHERVATAPRCTFCHHYRLGQQAAAEGRTYSSGWHVL